jgi:DNA polymerase III alpha subunit
VVRRGKRRSNARDDNRLSRLDERDHGRIRADPRFLKLVRLAEAKLKGRPRELGQHAVANILNGERITICCRHFCWCALSAESA